MPAPEKRRLSPLVGALKDLGIKPVLLAPTGRAAKVLAQYAQEKALTIHKRIYRQRTNADYESKFAQHQPRTRGGVHRRRGPMLPTSPAAFRQRIAARRPRGVCPQRPRMPSGAGRRQRAAAARRGRFQPGARPGVDGCLRRHRLRHDGRGGAAGGGVGHPSTPRWCAACSKTAFTRFPLRDGFSRHRGGRRRGVLEKLQDCYARYGRDETIVITRSNKRANRYNEGIRRNVLYAEEEIESGDMLMVVKNNYYYTGTPKTARCTLYRQRRHRAAETPRRYEDF